GPEPVDEPVVRAEAQGRQCHRRPRAGPDGLSPLRRRGRQAGQRSERGGGGAGQPARAGRLARPEQGRGDEGGREPGGESESRDEGEPEARGAEEALVLPLDLQVETQGEALEPSVAGKLDG